MSESTPTAYAVSPDSGEHWSAPGAWTVDDGVHRIPLPLPTDGLRAVNVYVLEGPDGLTLVDGGWAITEGRAALDAGLTALGFGFGDIRRFLVTHVHRDHYTLASVLGEEYAARVVLGVGDKPTLDLIHSDADGRPDRSTDRLLFEAGAQELAERWAALQHPPQDRSQWRYPDMWLDGDRPLEVAGRTLDAVHTPGHTQGHFVFADRPAGLLFAGDHVLPTITPSIGFEPVPVLSPLGDFMASLTKVRGLPDLRLLPAHGPIAPSSHARIDQLLAHHEHRLGLCLDALAPGPRTSLQVAAELPWTRHEHAFATLDLFNSVLACLETKAHLELLAARGDVTRVETEAGVLFSRA
ncbi:MBL fold metallo-hydrolase [Nocardioides cheoyonin]|uniref:MBL fold metallo-hydrolase n=1 Tax=Nocardioides cheoyonin TaxID=3156615 RepID=UPI0032B3F58E